MITILLYKSHKVTTYFSSYLNRQIKDLTSNMSIASNKLTRLMSDKQNFSVLSLQTVNEQNRKVLQTDQIQTKTRD